MVIDSPGDAHMRYDTRICFVDLHGFVTPVD